MRARKTLRHGSCNLGCLSFLGLVHGSWGGHLPLNSLLWTAFDCGFLRILRGSRNLATADWLAGQVCVNVSALVVPCISLPGVCGLVTGQLARSSSKDVRQQENSSMRSHKLQRCQWFKINNQTNLCRKRWRYMQGSYRELCSPCIYEVPLAIFSQCP